MRKLILLSLLIFLIGCKTTKVQKSTVDSTAVVKTEVATTVANDIKTISTSIDTTKVNTSTQTLIVTFNDSVPVRNDYYFTVNNGKIESNLPIKSITSINKSNTQKNGVGSFHVFSDKSKIDSTAKSKSNIGLKASNKVSTKTTVDWKLYAAIISIICIVIILIIGYLKKWFVNNA